MRTTQPATSVCGLLWPHTKGPDKSPRAGGLCGDGWGMQDYSDEVIFGWYAHQDCWAKPEQAPHCLPESGTGITSQRAERVLHKFVPK